MDLINFSEQFVLLYVLIFTRITSLFLIAPLFSTKSIPIQVKIWFAVFVTFIFTPHLALRTTVIPTNIWQIGLMLITEITTGFLIGFVALIAWNAIEFAAFEIDQIMGLHMAVSLNPVSNVQSSITGQLFFIFSTYIFLLINGHHWFITGLYRSFEMIPLGHIHISNITFEFITKLFSQLFLIGMEIALPIFAILFIINIILGVFARLVPQMNVFFLSFPVKINVGLVLLLFFMHAYFIIFSKILGSIRGDLLTIIKYLI